MNLWEAFYVLFLFLICKLHAGRVCAIRPDQLIPFLIHLNYLNFGLNRALISDRIAELIHLTASFVSCNYLLDSSCRRVFFSDSPQRILELIYMNIYIFLFFFVEIQVFPWRTSGSAGGRGDPSARTGAIRIAIWRAAPTAGPISTSASSKWNPAS